MISFSSPPCPHRYTDVLLSKDEELKSFLKRRVKNIRDTDCTMTYQVRFDDEEIPFYPFLINRQDKKVFGVVKLNTTQPGKIKYNWTKWDSKLFKRYYEWCHENMESDRFEMPPKPRKPLPEPLECSL
ncbi:hypothetical protein GCK32_005411 [Trichostrongylus colubriformis]|uniref:Uncharacterized protein n=1 Tax=Trichostrongylus colubriformis TaxID=6319 RepID=A0AAN8IR06_TRICO